MSMWQFRTVSRVGALLLACQLLSCAPEAKHAGVLIVPTHLIDIAKIPGDFSWRQSISAEFQRAATGGHRENASFEAVLEKQGNALTLVGLTSFGTRAFVAKQVGTQLLPMGTPPAELPFPPELVFQDIHRCYFIGLLEKPAGDGWPEQEIFGEVIRDEWQRGRLLERRFYDARQPTQLLLSIRYPQGLVPGQEPSSVELVNHRYHYRLKIQALE